MLCERNLYTWTNMFNHFTYMLTHSDTATYYWLLIHFGSINYHQPVLTLYHDTNHYLFILYLTDPSVRYRYCYADVH